MFVTFSLPALDAVNRFRYPPVSLSRDMCWWLWLGRRVPQQFLAKDLCTSRLGAITRGEKSPNSLADANFNALRRRLGHFELHVTCRDGIVFTGK